MNHLTKLNNEEKNLLSIKSKFWIRMLSKESNDFLHKSEDDKKESKL